MNKIFITIFMVIIWIPIIDMNLRFLPQVQNTEKRPANSLPVFGHTKLPEFISQFERYFNDNFGGRNQLIFINALLQTKLFQTSPIPQVIIGQKGWLFYKPEAIGDGTGLNDFLGQAPFTENELAKIGNDIGRVNQSVMNNQAKFLLLISPNKNTIYPEYLPTAFSRDVGTITRMDQLIAFNNSLENKTIYIDARQVLRDGKKTMPTYYQTDTHWNSFGAFLVSQLIVDAIYPQTPYPESLSLKAYQIEQPKKDDGDLAVMLAMPGIWRDNEIKMTSKNGMLIQISNSFDQSKQIEHYINSAMKGTKLVYFGDSYTRQLIPFLTQQFHESIFVFIGPSYKIDTSIIEKEKPNVVIWEVAERFTNRLAQ